MRVCLLINQIGPGGAPNLLLDIIKNTHDSNIEYIVCTIDQNKSHVDDFENAGADVIEFDASFKFDPRTVWKMLRFFHQQKFDVLHAHLPYSQTLGRILGHFGGCSSIVSTQHNVPKNYHPITRKLEQLTRPLDSRTIAVSEGVERAFTGNSARYVPNQPRQWCTIYNGIDVEEFNRAVQEADSQSIRNKWNVDADHIYVNVSRYVEAKAQLDLIAAMDDVIDDIPDAHLFIVGWGELEQQLRKEVADRELEDAITITGRVPTVHEYYALADAFVSSSIFEGLPIAHIEAMAAELPIVATDIPGVNEAVIDGESGILVRPERPTELADAIVDLTSSSTQKKFGEAGFQHAKEQFSIERTVDSHLSLYAELTENT